MALDYDRIKEAAEGYKPEMVRFLREMISYPSESTEEKEVVMCIQREMEKLVKLNLGFLAETEIEYRFEDSDKKVEETNEVK